MENSGLGRFIVSRRKLMRLTQKELAERIGVSKSAIAKWETGGGIPDRDNLKKLSDVMNVTVDDLLGMAGDTRERDTIREVNITPDLIVALESYGYKVVRPNDSFPDKVSDGS